MIILYLCLLQELEEPGPDDDRYDTLQLSLVHPVRSKTSPPPSMRCPSPWETPVRKEGVADNEEEAEDEDLLQLGILKQFTFSSELQVQYITCTVHVNNRYST